MRLLVPAGALIEDLDDEVARAFEAGLDRLVAAGALISRLLTVETCWTGLVALPSSLSIVLPRQQNGIARHHIMSRLGGPG